MATRQKLNLDLEKERRLQTYKGIASYNYKLFNSEVESDDLYREVTFTIPGLAFPCFNRLGIPAVWMVANQLDMPAMYWGYSHLGIVTFDKDLKGTFRVLVAQKYLFLPAFYEKVALNCPMKLRMEIKLTTDKAYVAEHCLHENMTGEPLVRNSRLVMFIDINTRKPTATPQKMRALKSYDPNGETFRVKAQVRPYQHFKYQFTVPHSDTDANAHLTQSAFIKYVMDAAAEATHKGYFKRFCGDLFSHHVHEFELAHKGECFAGDDLIVSVWEDPACSDLNICFLIEKKDKAVCFGEASFYPMANKHPAKL